MAINAVVSVDDVLRVCDLPGEELERLLSRFHLEFVLVRDSDSIDGTYWGEPEAGLVGHSVFARSDTPVHSVLHEACHAICMTAERRSGLHCDAGGDDLEEAAVCYLQIVLAEILVTVGSRRLMRDMDAWGYSFRLGDSASWFEHDACDARNWLIAKGLLASNGCPLWILRQT